MSGSYKTNSAKVDRRTFLGVTAGAALSAAASPSAAKEQGAALSALSDLNSLSDSQALEVYIKMLGSLEPATVYTWFSGHLWGIVPGTPAKQLVSFEGLAKSVWRREGDQLSKQSYDVGYFGDVATGEVIDEFKNPYTGKIVRPYHYAYGGGVTRYAKNGELKKEGIEPVTPKWLVSGDQAWFDETNSVSAPNPFKPEQWPLASAGKEIHFGSSTTNTARLSDLLDPTKTNIPYTLFWTAINSWEPWLHMGDTPGYVMWRATGRKLADLSEAPASIIDYVNKTQANYFKDEQPWAGTRSTWADYRRDRKPAANK